MTERLTLDRFRALTDAYGGVIARWPEADRADAMRMASDVEAMAILREASVLDDSLDAWRLPAPTAAVRDRVIASAVPAPRSRLVVRAKLWWSGIGIAATLAGAAAGTAAVAMVPPVDASPESGTSFGDVAGPES